MRVAIASLLVGMIGMVAACPAPAPRTATAPASAPDAGIDAPAPAADPLRAQLNLDFEDVDGGRVRGWNANTAMPEAATSDAEAHAGRASLRLAPSDEPFTAASTSLDATPYRGKRVTLHGWIRTRDVAAPAWAGLWLRVDGGRERVLDNMHDRPVRSADAWTEARVAVDVPRDAATILIGAILVGQGYAWFDDLRVEVGEPQRPAGVLIGGTVRDPDGNPLPGARVALIHPATGVVHHVATDANGRFVFSAIAGRWALSAQHPAGVAIFTDGLTYDHATDAVELTLDRGGGVTVRGRLTNVAVVPPELHVQVARFSQHEGDVFVVPLAADGTFTAVLPRGDKYLATLPHLGLTAEPTDRRGDTVDLVLDGALLAPAPPAIAAWIRQRGIPIATAEPGTGTRDLRPLAKVFGKARIVALGEATHGTREFFQLKHRLVEYLVGELGFTVFAIEANQPECRAINDYVVHGKGDARTALAGIYFWTWNTEEVLALIEWMRAWNADPRHRRKVRFTGFDMQTPTVAYATVAAFVRAHAGPDAEALLAPVAPFAERGREHSQPELAAIGAGLAALAARFALDANAWKAADPGGYAIARQDLRVLEQAHAMRAANGTATFDARDRAMAENVDWILAQEPPGTRMILWAHNGHVGRTLPSFVPMGHHLAQRHGAAYHAVGLGFGQGSFQAVDAGGRGGGKPVVHTVGPPPAWDVSVPFSASGHPIVAVDLRAARGAVRAWFAAPHLMRGLGSMFLDEANLAHGEVLTAAYDTVIFVDRTTAARALAR